ncbi:DUF6599 family protein [Acidobacteriota bacterium]
MKWIEFKRYGYLFISPIVIFLILAGPGVATEKYDSPLQQSLLPQLSNWTMTEEPSNYFPENLFEFINGAAEIYLAYDFKELTVSQYNLEGSTTSMAVEIYEMSNNINAFGIYGAERYPDNNFVSIGIQGYVEEGVLNYLIGKYYVKLLCFEGSSRSGEYLELFANAISEKTQGLLTFPTLLSHFPKEGLLPNSEKFILKNVMGYSFLHDGYISNYKVGDFEFDCFIIQGRNEEDAQMMLDRYLEAKKSLPIQKMDSIVSIKDRYYDLIYLSRAGSHICGVMKIEEGKEDIGQEYLQDLLVTFKK